MKFLAIALVAAACSTAFGDLTAGEINIDNAFKSLRAEPQIMLELNGTNQFGPRTDTLYSNAFFYWDPINVDSFTKAEVNDYLNNQHTHRNVADGTILWAYDFGRNVYSTFKYGSYSGAPPSGFRAAALNELSASNSGQSAYLARIIRDTYAPTPVSGQDMTKFHLYFGWFPGATITTVTTDPIPGAIAQLQDPVDKNRTYVADPLNEYVIYSYSLRQQRSIAFHLVRTDPLSQVWNLSNIYYADFQQINPTTTRMIDWTITVHTGVLPSSTTYDFKPPSTARAIANAHGQSGG